MNSFSLLIWFLLILQLPVVDMPLRYVPVLIALGGSSFSVVNNIRVISRGGKGKNGSSVAVRVRFQKHYLTFEFYENVALTGQSCSKLSS